MVGNCNGRKAITTDLIAQRRERLQDERGETGYITRVS